MTKKKESGKMFTEEALVEKFEELGITGNSAAQVKRFLKASDLL